jgi:hypothetical protein
LQQKVHPIPSVEKSIKRVTRGKQTTRGPQVRNPRRVFPEAQKDIENHGTKSDKEDYPEIFHQNTFTIHDLAP